MVRRVLKSIRTRLQGKPEQAAEKPKAAPAKPKAAPAKRSKAATPRARAKQPEVEVYEPGAARRKKKPADTPATPKAKATPRPTAKKSDEQPERDGTAPKRRRRRRRKPRSEQPTEATQNTPSTTPASEPPTPKAAPAEPWDPSTFQVPEEEGKTRFQDIDLPDEVLHAIADLGFQYCTPIQAGIMPTTLKGTDATGRAQTGTGKTAAFLITIFTRFLREPLTEERKHGTPRALILAPTRELVIQIEKEARELSRYTPVTTMAVFGGMDYEKQRKRLVGERIDVMVATPGRLRDFQRKRDLHLSKVEILVIDEADRMLDMGFIPDVRSIVHSTPPKSQRQTMLFSATLTSDVTRLASQWTRDPVTVEIEPENVAVDTVDQKVYITTMKDKFALLYNVIKQQANKPVIVFGNRRDMTQHLTDHLDAYGVSCDLLSGAVSQVKRLKTLEAFKAGKFQVLVATDVAGRGIHVDHIGCVVNYSLPQDPEDYVHRIGRTGRAGDTGTSVSFACEEDSFYIPDIEKYMGRELPCEYPDEELLATPPDPIKPLKPKAPSRPAGRRGGPRRGGGRGGPRRSSGGRGRR